MGTADAIQIQTHKYNEKMEFVFVMKIKGDKSFYEVPYKTVCQDNIEMVRQYVKRHGSIAHVFQLSEDAELRSMAQKEAARKLAAAQKKEEEKKRKV